MSKNIFPFVFLGDLCSLLSLKSKSHFTIVKTCIYLDMHEEMARKEMAVHVNHGALSENMEIQHVTLHEPKTHISEGS